MYMTEPQDTAPPRISGGEPTQVASCVTMGRVLSRAPPRCLGEGLQSSVLGNDIKPTHAQEPYCGQRGHLSLANTLPLSAYFLILHGPRVSAIGCRLRFGTGTVCPMPLHTLVLFLLAHRSGGLLPLGLDFCFSSVGGAAAQQLHWPLPPGCAAR